MFILNHTLPIRSAILRLSAPTVANSWFRRIAFHANQTIPQHVSSLLLTPSPKPFPPHPSPSVFSCALSTDTAAAEIIQQTDKAHSKRWTPEEDAALLKAYDVSPEEWSMIAEQVPGEHLPKSCARRYDVFQWGLAMENRESDVVRAWTEEEDRELERCYKAFGPRWAEIAEAVGGGRTKQEAWMRYDMLFPTQGVKNGLWTEEEDALLKTAIEKYGENDWTAVAGEVPGRTDKQCRYRHSAKHMKIKKGSWDLTEDAALVDTIKAHGTKSWSLVSEEFTKITGVTRTGKQCRRRWRNSINPELAKGPWTAEEIEAFQKTYEKYGPSIPPRSIIFLLPKLRSYSRVQSHWKTVCNMANATKATQATQATH
ncbi:hypothetical protein BC938DRAFT_479282 [Jimgerdemannia flammicorona]|uniref:Homeodomain-like protein n=1 Tax=Jimgerdemannia flammicorona TaxID=994334 RepID=A0A433QL81_9FUNG|nr:hypothetical protein BC938DRAFT_479282 [Jimgerdemannia flammicorona]